MKRILAIILVLIMVFSLPSCAGITKITIEQVDKSGWDGTTYNMYLKNKCSFALESFEGIAYFLPENKTDPNYSIDNCRFSYEGNWGPDEIVVFSFEFGDKEQSKTVKDGDVTIITQNVNYPDEKPFHAGFHIEMANGELSFF